ncbi:MAG: inositol monophosphatase [Desulfobacterota bacterium]|nr:inositol monophosphatase [Thermodesulfobacteriota bacterium]
MSLKESEPYLAVALQAAREAGKIQMDHFGRPQSITYKGEFDPVTEVDRLCDLTIQRTIRQQFPEHEILTEESPFQGRGGPWRWIIDPLDGTTNYARGFPFFSISIALEREGEVILGVVYIPILDELFVALKGGGAYLNERRIRVSQTGRLRRSFIATGFPYDVQERPDDYLPYFRQFIRQTLAIRRPGSAAIDLCYVAAGRFDGFWEFKLKPWDIAAGSLMIREAGGKVTDPEDKPFDIYSAGLLIATNGLIHEEMLQSIQEVRWSGGPA